PTYSPSNPMTRSWRPKRNVTATSTLARTGIPPSSPTTPAASASVEIPAPARAASRSGTTENGTIPETARSRRFQTVSFRAPGRAAGEGETRDDRGLMAEVAREAHELEARVLAREIADHRGGRVGRAVVHQDALELVVAERGGEPGAELGEVRLLVAHRDDDGDHTIARHAEPLPVPGSLRARDANRVPAGLRRPPHAHRRHDRPVDQCPRALLRRPHALSASRDPRPRAGVRRPRAIARHAAARDAARRGGTPVRRPRVHRAATSRDRDHAGKLISVPRRRRDPASTPLGHRAAT